MNKKTKNFWIFALIIIGIILLGMFGNRLFTVFYGLNEVKCSFNMNNLDCKSIGASSFGSEFDGSSPNDLIPFSISNAYDLYYKQSGTYLDLLKSSDFPIAKFLNKNSFCKSNAGNLWFNGDEINSLCQSTQTCYTQGQCPISNNPCSTSRDCGCSEYDERNCGSRRCIQGYQYCSCSLKEKYDLDLSKLGIGARSTYSGDCGGFISAYANSNDLNSVNVINFYYTSPSELIKNNFPNQLVLVEGQVCDKRDIDNPTNCIQFKTFGFCDNLIDNNLCQIHAPSVNKDEFPRSHAQISSMKVILKVGGYNKADFQCVEGMEKCEGQTYSICQNYKFVSQGNVDGKCGYSKPIPQENISQDNPEDINNPIITSSENKTIIWVFLSLLSLLVIILIIWLIIRKK